MRPRVFPAEDDEVAVTTQAVAAVASMRPRVFPAEDVRNLLRKVGHTRLQ